YILAPSPQESHKLAEELERQSLARTIESVLAEYAKPAKSFEEANLHIARLATVLSDNAPRILAALRSSPSEQRLALERARGCIKGLLARTPVRDVTETLAEIDAAIAASGGAKGDG